tara:strand:- start:25 stop:324 length:300 start_codon:yes stop_codon:yes gene_type:complete
LYHIPTDENRLMTGRNASPEASWKIKHPEEDIMSTLNSEYFELEAEIATLAESAIELRLINVSNHLANALAAIAKVTFTEPSDLPRIACMHQLKLEGIA